MISQKEVQAAAKRIASVIDVTPCIKAEALSSAKTRVFLKLENLQKTGSFKLRGAFNKISQLSAKEKKAGVIAASAGNHSQGVAYAAKQLGVKATIVMPKTSPLIKITNTRALDATVLLEGETFDDAFQHAKMLAKKKGLTLIHAFDDDAIIAGQGTIGLEILDQVPNVDVVIVPIGGGGLISGVAAAIKSQNKNVKIIGVQAEGAPYAHQFFHKKSVSKAPPFTIADGIAVKHPGKNTSVYIRKFVDDVITVSDEEITASIVRMLERRKLIIEPAGIVALAAVRSSKVNVVGKTTVCVLSGGNIDIRMLSSIIRKGMVKEGRIYEFTTVVRDRPGALHKLTELIAKLGCNILEIHHERLNPHSSVLEVDVDIIVETMNANHISQLKSQLEANGYNVKDR